MFIAVSFVILIAIAVGLIRAVRGPSLFDRVLAVNMIGTLTVLMVAVLGFMSLRPSNLMFIGVAPAARYAGRCNQPSKAISKASRGQMCGIRKLG